MGGDEISIFSRIAKYSPGDSLDPKENRLTEILAGVLEHSDLRLSVELARMLLNPDMANSARSETRAERARAHLDSLGDAQSVGVETQVPLSVPGERGGQLDLLLTFLREDRETILTLGVEVKLWTGIHGRASKTSGEYLDQAALYSKALELTNGVLVLLAPASQLNRGELRIDKAVELSVGKRSWESVGALIADFGGLKDTDTLTTWLAEQFAEYLNEEGLMPQNSLSDIELIALDSHKRATDKLKALVAHARTRIAEEWTALPAGEGRTVQYDGRDGLAGWKHYATSSAKQDGATIWGEKCWFEFATKIESRDFKEVADRLEPADLRIIAGVSSERANAIPEETLREARSANPDFFEYRDADCHRFVRIATLREILGDSNRGETTLEEQGRMLGDWALDAFRALTA